MIYCTVGTMFLDFSRLILKVDEIAAATGERTIVQTGLGQTMPLSCEHFDFKPAGEVLEIQRQARVIVCHGGIGSVLDALRAGRPLVVVPRLAKHKEHMNDHQLDIARAVQDRGWGRMVLDVDELPGNCANPPGPPTRWRPAEDRLLLAVRDAVDRAAGLADARRMRY